jgi:hypothetical protein
MGSLKALAWDSAANEREDRFPRSCAGPFYLFGLDTCHFFLEAMPPWLCGGCCQYAAQSEIHKSCRIFAIGSLDGRLRSRGKTLCSGR